MSVRSVSEGEDGERSGLVLAPGESAEHARTIPLDMPPFAPSFPWIGGDLQTLRNRFRRGQWPTLVNWPRERLRFLVKDGTGDVLLGVLNRPARAQGKPLVILLHGLTGCETSAYIRYAADIWLRRGHPVLRLNLRGAGPSRPLCRRHYHGGKSEDLATVLEQLSPSLSEDGIVVVGYSLGANLMLKYLAEAGEAAPVRAAAAVSAPIDLARTSERMHSLRNLPYMHWFVSNLKRSALAAPGLGADLRRAIGSVRTVRQFDDRVIAPENGFANAEDYYAQCSAAPMLGRIRVPTVLVHSPNDPWIPADIYHRIDWHSHPYLTPLLEVRGGHVGFHGREDQDPWHERAIGAFLEGLTGGLGRER